MELILVILTSVLLSAFLFASFIIGYAFGKNHKSEDGVNVTQDNKDFIEEMMKWKNFDGRR